MDAPALSLRSTLRAPVSCLHRRPERLRPGAPRDRRAGREPGGVLRALTNALVRRRHRPTVAELSAVYQDVRRSARAIRCDLRTRSLLKARFFDELAVAGRISAERRVPLLPRRRQGRTLTAGVSRRIPSSLRLARAISRRPVSSSAMVAMSRSLFPSSPQHLSCRDDGAGPRSRGTLARGDEGCERLDEDDHGIGEYASRGR